MCPFYNAHVGVLLGACDVFITMSCLREICLKPASGILLTQSSPLPLHAVCMDRGGPLDRVGLRRQAPLFGADGRVLNELHKFHLGLMHLTIKDPPAKGS